MNSYSNDSSFNYLRLERQHTCASSSAASVTSKRMDGWIRSPYLANNTVVGETTRSALTTSPGFWVRPLNTDDAFNHLSDADNVTAC